MSNQPPCRILAAPPPDAAAASAVVRMAAGLADRLGAELLLLGVAPVAIPPTGGRAPATIRERRDALRAAQARLEDATRTRLESLAAGVQALSPVRTIVVSGRSGPAIVLAAREHEADLVVVGMRRAGRAAHLLHDGADRYVLRHSAVPVVVVPYDTAFDDGTVPAAA